MICSIRIVRSECGDVYLNQGAELNLFEEAEAGVYTLYLWSNERAVVIGRNQDAFAECDVVGLRKAGGQPARRLSGGGAVYHDSGNLNFTFIAKKEDFSLELNRAVILAALARLGIDATLTGRNDIEAGGGKISGNAYYSRGDTRLHHGTILISSSAAAVAEFLTPSAPKLGRKAVSSVAGRVTNLNAIVAGIDKNRTQSALENAFRGFFPEARAIEETADTSSPKARRAAEFFSDDTWIYGSGRKYDLVFDEKIATGEVKIKLSVCGESIEACEINSDSLDWEYVCKLQSDLTGVRFGASLCGDAARVIRRAEELSNAL